MSDQVIHVLSIEDNRAEATLIQEMLAAATGLGWDLPRFEVEHVEQLQAALARLEAAAEGEAGAIDVVLSDLDLPDSQASQTVATLREHIPRMPIVVLTGREDESLAHKSVRAGVQDYLYKEEATGSLLARTMLYAIERQQIHAGLEQRVDERTAELRQANEELRAEIAERKQAEKVLAEQKRALQESEKKYRDIFELSPDGIVTINLRGIVTSCNTAFSELTGFPKEAFVGKHFTKAPTLIDQDIPGWIKLFVSIIQGKRSGQITFRWRHRDGTTRWAEARADLMRRGARITGLQAIATDVTERKRAEEKIQRRNRELTALNAIAVAVGQTLELEEVLDAALEETLTVLDIEGGLVYLFDEAERMFMPVAHRGVSSDVVAEVTGFRIGQGLSGRAAASGDPLVVGDLGADPRNLSPAAVKEGWRSFAGVPIKFRDEVLGVMSIVAGEENRFQSEHVYLLKRIGNQVGLAIENARLYRQAQEEIAERKRAEEALQESLEKYRVLFESFPLGITVADSAGQILETNEESERLLGISREEHEARSIDGEAWHIIRPDGSPMPAEEYASVRALREGRLIENVEMGIVKSDGDVTWINVTAAPLRDRMVITYNDVTERKRAEDALRESERRYQELFENSRDGLVVVDAEGRFLEANQAYCQMLGYTLDELKQKVDFYEITPPRWRDWERREIWEKRLLQEGYSGVYEKEYVRKDGTIFPVELQSYTVFDEEGEPRYLWGVARDITERKRAAEALQESEQWLSTTLRSIGDGVIATDAQGRVRLMNPTAEALTGWDEAEAIAEPLEEVFHIVNERTGERAESPLESVLREGVIVGLANHTALIAKDGTKHSIADSAAPIEDQAGAVIGTILVFRDVSERKRAERELERRRQLWDALMENTPDLVYFKDNNHRMIRASRAYADVLEMDVEDVVGKTALELWPEGEEIIADERKVLAGEPLIRKERKVTVPGGDSVWYLLTKIPIYQDGDVIGFFAIDKDITERKQVEERLAFQSMLLDKIEDKVTATDLEGRITYVNEAESRAFGKAVDELIGQHVEEYGEDPERGATQQEIIDATLTEGRWRGEVVNITEDGREIILDSRTQLIYDEGGEPIGMLGISTDVTERKRAEEKLEHYAAELERSNRDLEQFGSIVSHDLQAPLRVVKNYLQILQDHYDEQLDSRADRYIATAVDSARRMQKMIRALLDLSRVGTQGAAFAPTDVEAVLERTLKVLDREIEDAEAEVTHDPLPTVMADEAQLTQVFQNLIANGIKFRREDVPPRVHVSAERAGDEWLFSVADNGIGIDPEQNERVFRVFQRLHTEDEYPGLGMGLALCKRIVERHGGRIWVESEIGEGATLTFTLPV